MKKIVFSMIVLLSMSLAVGCSNGAVQQSESMKPQETLGKYQAFYQSQEDSRQAAYTVAAQAFEENFDYDDKASMPEIAGAMKDIGAVPVIRNWMKPLFRESVPTEDEIMLSPREIRVARGEDEPFSFGVHALVDQSGVYAVAENFEGTEAFGNVDGLSVEVFWVESAPIRHGGSSRSKKYQVQPVRLWPQEAGWKHDVAAGDNFQFWATIKVADSVEPGTYPVFLIVNADAGELYRVRVDVEVLPFELPAVKAAYGVYEGHPVSDAEIADLKAHGCNSVSMWGNYPSYDEATKTLDMSKLDAYLRRLKSSGLYHSWVWYVDTKNHQHFRLKDRLGEDGIVAVLKKLNEGVEAGYYPENVALTIDEAVCNFAGGTRGDKSPEGSVGNRWDDFKWLMKKMHEVAPSLKRFGVSLNRFEDAKLHGGLIDILSNNGDFDKSGEWTAEHGIDMYTYGSFNKGTYPANSRFNCGFYPWSNGSEGTYCWAYKWSGEDPFNDLDGGHTDWNLVFEGPNGEMVSTPAWEAWREGVDDRRYVELYQSLVEQGKADGALLDEVRDSMRPDKFMEETKVGDSDFGAIVNNYGNMVSARNKLIDAIVAASAK